VYTQTAPPATPAASSPQGALTPERRESLAAFYKKHDQTKLKDVDEILSMYEFSATVSSLKAKYGEVPPGWEESQTNAERLRFVNQKHDPSKIAQVQTILANYDFVETVKSLQTRYGELPDGWGSYLERGFDSARLWDAEEPDCRGFQREHGGCEVQGGHDDPVSVRQERGRAGGHRLRGDVRRSSARITATSMTARLWWRPAARTCRFTRRASTQFRGAGGGGSAH
jgi:hypothetical protein